MFRDGNFLEAQGYCGQFRRELPNDPGAEIVGAIANKFGCTIQQAERKITATMDILQLDRETAVVFLREVRHYGLKPPKDQAEAPEPR